MIKKIALWLLGMASFGNLFAPLAFAEGESVDLVFVEQCEKADIKECAVLDSSDTKTVNFSRSLKQGDKFRIAVLVKNEDEKNIVTVRSWLKYDTSLLKAVDLSEKNSDFPLAAPDGNKIDESTGQIQIGRGITGGGIKEKLLLIATIEFEVISPQTRTTEISFVNFQKDILGETGVFILNQQTFQPENIMENAPKSLKISLNEVQGGSITPEPSSPNPENNPNNPGTNNPNPSTETRLARPDGLRVQAQADSTNLIWNLSNDAAVKGYFVYYSENSGFYIRRHDVGRTNHQEFTDLKKNQKYYFAVTAYDANGKESDYSDEVSATHGVPGSESHPFEIRTNEGTKVNPPVETDLNGSGPRETMTIFVGILGLFCLAYSSLRLRLFS